MINHGRTRESKAANEQVGEGDEEVDGPDDTDTGAKLAATQKPPYSEHILTCPLKFRFINHYARTGLQMKY